MNLESGNPRRIVLYYVVLEEPDLYITRLEKGQSNPSANRVVDEEYECSMMNWRGGSSSYHTFQRNQRTPKVGIDIDREHVPSEIRVP
jgi:hypothetical protein